ncbi:MAG: dTDP-4-dehydrorhamnose 3,5-epimerase family protein, partial [Clostridia bacterium]|nr:dTDP-4-dehydrorhamnose 3,5-epimerase family protein [Clostridia bacterium]
LSAENKQMLFIPKGFLHGFVTLTDNVEVFYKVDAYYNKDADRSVRYNDPVFAIDWGVETPVLSQKDQNAPLLSASDVRFTDGGVL